MLQDVTQKLKEMLTSTSRTCRRKPIDCAYPSCYALLIDSYDLHNTC